MFRLRLAWIGKVRSPAAAAWSAEYLQRCRRFAQVEAEELAPRKAEAALLAHAARRLWLLDPAGAVRDSPAFAAWLERECTRTGGEVTLALGGPDGFPPALHAAAAGRLSLSALTFSHELALVMACEQLYRALTIVNGHPYPR